LAVGDAEHLVKRALLIARRDPDRQADVDEGLEWLNEIHQAILADGTPWSFLVATGQADLVADQQRYTLSSLGIALGVGAIERVLGVVNDEAGGTPLKGMDWITFERYAYGSQGDPHGYPNVYTQLSLGANPGSPTQPTILFYPTPDKPYTLGFIVRRAVEPLDGDDFPLIPRAHASAVLVPYVAARMWNQQAGGQAANEAVQHDARHQRALARLVEAYGSAREGETTLIEPTLYDAISYGYGSIG
jgi:hypothetical protein